MEILLLLRHSNHLLVPFPALGLHKFSCFYFVAIQVCAIHQFQGFKRLILMKVVFSQLWVLFAAEDEFVALVNAEFGYLDCMTGV